MVAERAVRGDRGGAPGRDRRVGRVQPLPARAGREQVGQRVGRAVLRDPQRAAGLPEREGETELADWCRARLAACKTPVRWLFTDGFPLTSTGKIRKDVLSGQLADAGPVSAPR